MPTLMEVENIREYLSGLSEPTQAEIDFMRFALSAEKKQRNSFYNGIIIGAIATLLLCMIVVGTNG